MWGALRFGSTAGPQVRDAIFQPVSEEAQRRAGTRVFSHVHALSVRFHQSKRTGAVYRTIERGVRAIDFLLRFLAFNILPTLIELVLAAGVLAWKYGGIFPLIAAITVALYAWMTFGVTEWRLKYRRDMNERDTEAAGRAVDSLLNFETVKSFAAESRESARYDLALSQYAEAAVRSNTSLVLLNVVQGFIMNVGLIGMVLAAGFYTARGGMGPGDITAVIDLKGARPGRRLYQLTPDQVRSPFGVEVIQIAPASVALEFEESATRKVAVVVSVDGDPAPGYITGTPIIEPAEVEIVVGAVRAFFGE